MVIRETATELDLCGTPVELRAVGRALAALGSGERCRFEADTHADPAPYTRVLVAFEAEASGGPVRLSVAGQVLSASGSPDMLATFASFFEFSDDDRPGTHTHHEWWDGNDYIAADSRPLVISRAEPAASPVRDGD
ncbi:MAG: hypothetical protein C0483_26160 [Pirellula sp.]|nr:hypothetical protein [Pirellula sp.]